jgi:3-hydroxyacyl-CoA dehydrogenase
MSSADVIGVVGAGVMGAGIAQCAVRSGLGVVLQDPRPDALDRASARVRQGLRLQRMLSGGQVPPNAMERLTLTTSVEDLRRAAFVVETVVEDISVKEEVFRQLDVVCPPEVCFASNTSAIPIAHLAGVTRRESQVLGLHFMNPAPMKPTVELIRAERTAEATVATARGWLARMGKDAVEVKDGVGFVGNRVLMAAIHEAISLAAEGAAAPAEIDRVFTACLGHKMGPLGTADLIGLDNVLDTLKVLARLAGARYAPPPLLQEMVARGDFGVKTECGFFNYPKEQR